MKKILFALMLVATLCANALSVLDGATAIKKATSDAIKAGDYADVERLLEEVKTADAKTQVVALNAIQSAFNSTRLTAYTAFAAQRLNAHGVVTIRKVAGGKWSVTVNDGRTKTAIPRAAVEKPTLSTNPAANKR